MKNVLILITLLLCLVQVESQEIKENIIGKWKIDLRPTPKSPEYFQEFEIKSIDKKEITGTFYGSKIIKGLINTEWSKIYFAFSTSDKTHTYFHSGYFEKGKVYGISYCPTRNFTAPWTGELKKKN